MDNIVVLTQATNVAINDEFWGKVNQLVGEYYKTIDQAIIPEKPLAPELETAWIYEILNEAFRELQMSDMIILDGRMQGNIIYNLAVGMLLAMTPRYGSLTVIGDPSTNELLQVSVKDMTEVQTLHISETPGPQPDQEGYDPEVVYVTLENSLPYLRNHSPRNLIIDNSYSANNDTIQRALGSVYYRNTNVTYAPETSNAFVDFIVNS